MEKPEVQIENLLKSHLSPIKAAFFFNGDVHEEYKCLHSSIGEYQTKSNYLLYDLPAVLRLLGLKSGLFEENMEAELYRQSLDELCFILDWQLHAKKIIIFEVKNLEHWDQENFLKTIKENNNILNEAFDKFYIRNRDK